MLSADLQLLHTGAQARERRAIQPSEGRRAAGREGAIHFALPPVPQRYALYFLSLDGPKWAAYVKSGHLTSIESARTRRISRPRLGQHAPDPLGPLLSYRHRPPPAAVPVFQRQAARNPIFRRRAILA